MQLHHGERGPRRSLIKRCPKCSLCPQPRDIEFFWGSTPEEVIQDLCKKCRMEMGEKMSITPTAETDAAIMFYVPKLRGLTHDMVKETLLGVKRRRFLSGNRYRGNYFITDGERIWKYTGFPYNARSPMAWENFLKIWPTWRWFAPEKDAKHVAPMNVTPFEHIMTSALNR